MDDCVFCRIVAGSIPSERIHEDERTVAFMDLSPATRGHALVVPRRHARDLTEIEPEDAAACAVAARLVARAALAALGADGVSVHQSNGRAAGQTVFHYHVHVIPRYTGDPLRLFWDPAKPDPSPIGEAAAALRGAL
jgi:histidine triad (HIT) family protein